MNKTVDVDLRIRAKNLSKSTLAEINADVERLTKSQQAQAKASDLAARSMKDLVAEQNYLAAASRELSRRSNLAEQFSKERVEIEKTSAKIKALTELRKRAAAAPVAKGAAGQQMGGLDKEITQSESALKRLAAANEKTGSTLRALGVDTNVVEKEIGELSAAAAKSGASYTQAANDVARYGAAVEHNNAIVAEATRRQKELTGSQRAVNRFAGEKNAATGQAGQLKALREQIEGNAKLARATEIAGEAQRRSGQEAATAAAQQQRASAAIRESINAYVARKNAQAGITKAFQEGAVAQEREAALNNRLAASQAASNERKARLVKLLSEERVQRMMGINSLNQSTAATEKNASATGRAAQQQQLFADTGRKSLSVYQRIRGQVLGLAAAYIGVYQVIGTFQNALEAVNRNQGLNIGLKVVNSGDAKAAASDYKFLREEADRLGLVFDDIAPKFVGMAIAGKAVGLTGQQIRDAFSNVATSVSAGNLSMEDSEGVFRAIVQVMSKARVQAEELRGQLGDRLPGAVAEFAKANNIALTDLDEHLKKGKGNVDQFLKFLEQYSAKYAPTLDEATSRLQANINRARNAYNDWLRQLLSSSNQTALKGAFKALEEFFKGKDGEKFAEALGNAFKVVIEVFMLLVKNIELVSKVLKAFLLIQATKFAIDMANSMKNLAIQIAAVGNASAVANGKTTALAGGFGKLKVAAVGVAGILLGITAVLDGQSARLQMTTDKLRTYIDLLDKLGTRQGIAKAASFDESVANVKAAEDVIQANNQRLRQLDELEKKGLSFTQGFGAIFGQNDLPITTKGLDEERASLAARTLELERSISHEREVVQPRLLAAQLKADEDAAKEAKPVPVVVETDPDKKKAKKGIDPEEVARRQADAERAAADKIIEIQDDIAAAKIDKAAKTDEQIEANYNATLERISLKIAETQNDIAKLQQNSTKVGVDNSAEFTRMDGLLQNLEAELQKKAEYEKMLALVELRETRINDLLTARDAKLQLINAQVQLGTISAAEGYAQATLAQDTYNASIRTEISAFETFIAGIQMGGPLWMALGLDETRAKLAQIAVETQKLSNTQLFKNKFGGEIAQGFSNAFNVFAQGIAGAIQGANSLGDAFKGAADAFLNFAADFLQKIAMMIIQQVILNALSGGGGGSFGQIFSQAMGGATGHTGGVVKSGKIGTGNAVRPIAPSHFLGAQRFHEGGLPGLKTGEVTAILKKREEVVTADDPRNVLNGGMTGGAAPNVTVVNSIDSASVVQQGWGGARNTILNDVKANQAQWRANLGITK